MASICRAIGFTILYAGIAAGLPALVLGLTLAIQLLTDDPYCKPGNWPVC